MTASSILRISDLRSLWFSLPLDRDVIRRRLLGVSFMLACLLFVSDTATAQDPVPEPTLVPGSEVSLSAIKAAEWIQGEGPTAFEPGKVYMFECWATWCGPCIGMIPHVNELHRKYYDKGLRVYGMDCWENDKGKATKFVQKQGAGMSYPVAYAGEGSPFETEWLTAAGVASIPYAFIVMDGKLLLSTEAVRLTDTLVETLLSGDEGAKQVAAEIKAAYDVREETEKLISEMYTARRARDATKMVAIVSEMETLDPNHPEIPVMKLQLLIARKEWTAAVAALKELPEGESRNMFVMMSGMQNAKTDGREYSSSFVKALTTRYSEYITSKGKAIGPNHFVCLSILQWRLGDQQTALITAQKGAEVARDFPRVSEGQAKVYLRFAESVKDGTMPEYSELSTWQREAIKKAKAAE